MAVLLLKLLGGRTVLHLSLGKCYLLLEGYLGSCAYHSLNGMVFCKICIIALFKDVKTKVSKTDFIEITHVSVQLVNKNNDKICSCKICTLNATKGNLVVCVFICAFFA